MSPWCESAAVDDDEERITVNELRWRHKKPECKKWCGVPDCSHCFVSFHFVSFHFVSFRFEPHAFEFLNREIDGALAANWARSKAKKGEEKRREADVLKIR